MRLRELVAQPAHLPPAFPLPKSATVLRAGQQRRGPTTIDASVSRHAGHARTTHIAARVGRGAPGPLPRTRLSQPDARPAAGWLSERYRLQNGLWVLLESSEAAVGTTVAVAYRTGLSAEAQRLSREPLTDGELRARLLSRLVFDVLMVGYAGERSGLVGRARVFFLCQPCGGRRLGSVAASGESSTQRALRERMSTCTNPRRG